MFDIFNKLNEAKSMIEKAKQELESVIVEGQSEGGKVKVKANANKKILGVEIDPELIEMNDKEILEDLLLVAINRALELADKENAKHMQGTAQGLIPGFPGLF